MRQDGFGFGLHSNPVEFDGIKTWMVEPLTDSEKLNCVAAAKSVSDHVVCVIQGFGSAAPNSLEFEGIGPLAKPHRFRVRAGNYGEFATMKTFR